MIIEATGWELEATPWTHSAACAGTDPDLWFPQRGAPATEAKAICATCPVRTECRDYAHRWDVRHGIWGGLSERQRRRMQPAPRPPRLPAPHGTTTRYARGCRCTDCRHANQQYAEQRRELQQATSGAVR